MKTMAEQDYYQLLGVARDATTDQIRKAYKKLARQYHPDANPGDQAAAEKFKQIQEAYGVLGDDEKRPLYDRFGANYKHAAHGAPGGEQFHWSAGGEDIDLNDLLGGLFGGGGRGGFGGFSGQARSDGGGRSRSRPRRGEDLRTEIEVSFQTAVTGGQYELQLNRAGKSERLNVKIPAGVDQGSVIRLAGQGQPGTGNAPGGDLLVTIRVAAHPYFRREGKQLILDLPLTPAEAVLGAKVDVPTLTEGPVVLTIPPGTSSGTRLRLRGKGVPDRKGGEPGDQQVVVKIVVPRNPSEREQALYQELLSVSADNPRAQLWSS